MRPRAVLLVVALALPVAACGSGSGDTTGSAGKTERLHAARTSFRPIFQSEQGFRPGDAFIASSDLAGGGHKEAYCVISSRKHTDWCSVTIVRPEGQITAEGVFVDAPKLSGAIALLSGSGAYTDAKGTLTTTGLIDRAESITLRLG
jgi:hypothetical protein